jgi:probable rRNA maturation factor
MAITLRAPRGLFGLAPALRALVRAVLRGEERRPGEIGIVLARDEELRALNRRWRGIDRATDVLSFGYQPAAFPALRPPPREVSGDLVISLDRVIAQARRYRVSRGRELARLAVHGTLHLAGLDHQRAAERRGMRRREDRALRGSAAAVRALDRLLGAGPGR